MPGRPSTDSETESPTGCTKQLISVARRSVPAAELMRPPGMKPLLERLEEQGLPAGGVLLDRRQRARHAPPHVLDRALVPLRVLFLEHVEGDRLREDSEIAFVWFHGR